MTVESTLLSWLARSSARNPDGLPDAAPWLIWERGPWRPRILRGQQPEMTQAISLADVPRPEGEDSFCFHLGGGTAFSVGRRSDMDIVVNDVTVSRLHFRLLADADGWWLEAVRPVRVEDQPVAEGARVRMEAGMIVSLGAVRLSFQDPISLRARLAELTTGRPPPGARADGPTPR